MGNFRCRALEKHRDYKREHAGVLRSAVQGVKRVQVTSKMNSSSTSGMTQSKLKDAQSRKDNGQSAQGRLVTIYYRLLAFYQTKLVRRKTTERIT